ncbi:ATP-binding cassette domain-containing protein [Oceanivirga salmonicida]|uniref:ATP-binding cassette domain-containing protein n=2 Tax=Oceanivirga salmonicida TaxID=1769291 RepID=UPI00082C2D3E|nr:ATP-binding cassette domain-containing protein [Oceanivirga salmonicida]
MIKFHNIQKAFNNFLININFEIKKGEIFGIIGESGVGKTTILKIIQGITKQDSGEVKLNGNFSTIFQESNLLNNLTAFDNVALPLKLKKIYSDSKVLEALSFVGLENKKDAYPSSLSGGQKQRIAIARAIVNNPDILLCDEPTASLDKNTSKEMVNLLLKINKNYGTTIVLVTHELKIAKTICDRVALIDNGKILEIIDIDKKNINEKNLSYIEYAKEVLK